MTAIKTYLLALDLSLNRPGYAVLEITATSLKIAECGHLVTDRSLGHGGRLRQVREWIDAIAARYTLEPVFVKEEAPQTFSGHILQKSHGVAEEILADYRYIDYPNTTIKLIVGGHGKAEKSEVEAGVREILALKADFIFASDDESDAVGAAITHIAIAGRLPRNKRFDTLRARVDAWNEAQGKKAAAKARRKTKKRSVA